MKIWLNAFRLRTLPLAMAGILLGNFLAASEGRFSWRIGGLCVGTALLLQILSNLANDYGDFVHGADSGETRGPKRAVQTGQISLGKMRVALVVFVGLSLAVGYLLVQGQSHLFYIIGSAAILAALGYTMGPKPYGYAGLGDFFVLVFFGVVAVFGTYYLNTQRMNYEVFLPAFSCGFFCVAVLNINNMRDAESDARAGKITIPIRLGKKHSRTYHWTLLMAGIALAIVYTALNYAGPWQLLFLITLPLFLKNGLAISKAADLDPFLKQLALTTLLFCLCFGIGILV